MNDRVWADLQALFEYGELIWENEEPVLSSRAGRVQGFTDELEALRLILQVNERRNCCSYTAGTSAGVNSDVHVERGHLDQLATYWPALAGGSASFQVGKDYHWGGVVGTFNDLVKDIVTLGGGALGATLGLVIGVTHEATDWMGLDLGPGGTLGVIAGLAVFEVGLVEGLGSAGSFVSGTVAGVATGAVANELIQHRPLFGPREGAGTTKSSLTPVDVLTPTSVMPKIWTAPLGSFVMRP